MTSLDLIVRLSEIEEALKHAPGARTCRKLANGLAAVRSGLVMARIGDIPDASEAMAQLFEAAHAQGIGNAELVEAFNAAGERYPR